MEKHLKNGTPVPGSKEMIHFEEIGYKKAVEYLGHPNTFKLFLDQIQKGDFTDQQLQAQLMEANKKALAKALDQTQENISVLEQAINHILHVKVPEKKQRNQYLKSRLLELEKASKKKTRIATRKILPFFVWLFASFLLVWSYSLIGYSAFHHSSFPGILPDLSLFGALIQEAPFWLGLPLLVGVLGFAFLSMVRSKRALAYWLKLLIIVAILVTNLILATQILQAANDTNLLLDLPEMNWYQSIEFWQTLADGIVTFAIWVIALRWLAVGSLVGRPKLNIHAEIRKIQEEIEVNEASIDVLRYKEIVERQGEIDRLHGKIERIKEQVEYLTFDQATIDKCLLEFGRGWISFFRFDTDQKQREECQKILDSYQK